MTPRQKRTLRARAKAEAKKKPAYKLETVTDEENDLAFIGALNDDNLATIMDFVAGNPNQLLDDIDFILKGFAIDKVAMLTHLHVMALLDTTPHRTRWDGFSCIYEQTSCMLNRQGVHLPEPIESTRDAGSVHNAPFHEHRSIRPVYFALRVDDFRDLYAIYTDVTINTRRKNDSASRLFARYKLILNRLGFTFCTFGFFDNDQGQCQPYYLVSIEILREPTSLFFFLESVYYNDARLPSNTEIASTLARNGHLKHRVKAVKELRESPGATLLSNLLFHREYIGVYYLVFARCDRHDWVSRSTYFNRRVQYVTHVDHLRMGHVGLLKRDSIERGSTFYDEVRGLVGDHEDLETGIEDLLSAALIAKTELECHDSVIRVTLPSMYSHFMTEIAASTDHCDIRHLGDVTFDDFAAERTFRLTFGVSPVLHAEISHLAADPRWQNLAPVTVHHSEIIEDNVVNVPIIGVALQLIGTYFPNAILVQTIGGYHLNKVIKNTRARDLGKFFFGLPSIVVSKYRAKPASYFGTLQYSELASSSRHHSSCTYNLVTSTIEFMRFASYRHGAMGFSDLISSYDIYKDRPSCELYEWFDVHPRIRRHFARTEAFAFDKLMNSGGDLHATISELLLDGVH